MSDSNLEPQDNCIELQFVKDITTDTIAHVSKDTVL